MVEGADLKQLFQVDEEKFEAGDEAEAKEKVEAEANMDEEAKEAEEAMKGNSRVQIEAPMSLFFIGPLDMDRPAKGRTHQSKGADRLRPNRSGRDQTSEEADQTYGSENSMGRTSEKTNISYLE